MIQVLCLPDTALYIPLGISLCLRRYSIAHEQVEKIVGSAAPEELLEQLK
jgi:hypothetical protein